MGCKIMNKEDCIAMGERIRLLRKTLGLNQEDFAEKLEMKQRVLSNIERGERELLGTEIKKLREVFKVNADWIVFGEGDMIQS